MPAKRPRHIYNHDVSYNGGFLTRIRGDGLSLANGLARAVCLRHDDLVMPTLAAVPTKRIASYNGLRV